MAVSQMQRVQIFAHSSHRASLIKDLQDLEIIHVNDLNEQEKPTDEVPLESEVRTIIRGMQNDLSRLQSAVNYLSNFEPKKGFIAGLLGDRVVLSSQEYAEIAREESDGEWRNNCNECQSLENEATNLTSRESRLKNDRENLRLWSSLDVPIEEIQDTEKVAIRIGIVPLSTYDGLLADIENSEADVAFEAVGETKTEVYLTVMFLKSDEQEAYSILTRYGFSSVSLSMTSGTVNDQLKHIEQELLEISSRREGIAKESYELATHRNKLMAIYDHMTELLRQEEIREAFAHTEYTFTVDGWVRKKDVKNLTNELSEKYDEVEIIASDPLKEDEPPVDLEIKGPADPFQMVTRLYGIPNYREIDPTPLIAPFFAFFFGICITDAGYGFIVALVAILAVRKVTGGGKNLLRLLVYAGLATIVVGAMTGGWFGISPDKLPGPLLKLRLLDPQGSGQMDFLKAILVIGFIQVWFGFFVKLYIDIRERDWAAACFDELPWVLAMILIGVAGFLWLSHAPMISILVIVVSILLCCSVIILFAGRESSNPVARIGTGGFELYTKITGTFGDVLSYLRLFALGLATGIIASVINTMGGMMWGSPIGKVVAIGIFIGGHIFNLVINALGGFIHTARLQFVEFFTKFYEGGGEEFRPFKREHTYVTVVDAENLQKGR